MRCVQVDASLLLARLRVVTVAGVCRRLSLSVICRGIHGGPAGGFTRAARRWRHDAFSL